MKFLWNFYIFGNIFKCDSSLKYKRSKFAIDTFTLS